MINSQTDKISVIIPTFNRASCIEIPLKSLLAQTYNNWECIIIDDRSTDNTSEIVEEYCKKDSRFIYKIRNENLKGGAQVCRNIGLSIITGNYVQFLDSDDWLAENKFESQLKLFSSDNSLDIATCKWGRGSLINSKFKVYENLPTYKNIKHTLKLLEIFGKRFTYFPLHVYLIPRVLINKTEGWDESIDVNQDGEYMVRILLQSTGIKFTPKTFVIYNTGSPKRTAKNKNESKIINYIKSLKKINFEIQKSTGISNHIYPKMIIAQFYKRLIKTHPQIIDENQVFFTQRKNKISMFAIKLNSKIKDTLNL